MPFEYVVRPFQTPDAHGRVIIPSTPGGAERATLTWGSKHAAPGTMPTPHSLGVNVQCCNETIKENSRSGDSVKITASNSADNFIMVQRATEVKLRKKDENSCNDWYSTNSYVASGIKEAFSEMASLIHASDKAFLPGGSTAECNQTLKLQPNTSAP